MATQDHPGFQSSDFREMPSQSNVFYGDSQIKKDSELQLTDQQAQELIRKAEISSSSIQQQVLSSTTDADLVPVTASSPSDKTSEMVADLNSSSDADDDGRRLSQSDRQHICMTCYKTFRNKPQLSQHELVHNNVRKHVCSYCDKGFKQICHLNQHMRVHTGERPYKCDVEGCDRSFAQLSNLNHHKKNHEEHVKRDISRHFRCEVCDRSYATKQSLNTHIQKLHTNLKAPEGSVTSPIVTPSSAKRKRCNRKDEPRDTGQLADVSSFLMDCEDIDNEEEDIDDDLPTQVKVKPRFSAKTSLTVRIGTPPGDRERSQGPRTTLPLPFSLNQGIRS
ncbi:zinc finger and SCAN domain-containing protein 22-like isoform X2 [Mya arenaria]|uniref:zinc finger and SCAN domain-containing protein 22-like isoform X2 n=1 Tax=Mya arenaria TaxID=6604 RepID=UPI0022E352A0|nr:zinc finger and SCAN domain-containing protein 22-like isoform X2 [Mya arenaria]